MKNDSTDAPDPEQPASESESPSEVGWSQFAKRRQDREAANHRAREEASARAAPGLRTKEALYALLHGLPEAPTTDLNRDRILISDDRLADLVMAVATAWKACPGLDVLVRQPLPDVGIGYEAGHELLKKAAAGSLSVAEMAEECRAAREALGPYLGWGSLVPPGDTEAGLIGFFSQLDHYFDGRSWAPPAFAATDPNPAAQAPSLNPSAAPRRDASKPTRRAGLSKSVQADAAIRALHKRVGTEILNWTLDRLLSEVRQLGMNCSRSTIAKTEFWVTDRPKLQFENAASTLNRPPSRSK